MTDSGNRILTTHVGSLIRPAELLERSKAAQESPQAQARYEETLRCATADVVEQQLEAGTDIVNDGEFGKSSWSNYVLAHEHEWRVWQTTKLPAGKILIPASSRITRRPSSTRGSWPIGSCGSRRWSDGST